MRFERDAVWKKLRSPASTSGAYSLRKLEFAPGREISGQTLEEIIECRWIAKRVAYQRRDSCRNGKSIAITGATGCGKRFLTMVLSCKQSEGVLVSSTVGRVTLGRWSQKRRR